MAVPTHEPTVAARLAVPEGRPRVRRRRWSPGLVTSLLVLAALSLMLVDVRGGPTDALRGAIASAIGPVQSSASGLLATVPDQLRRPDAAALEDELARLREENERLALGNALLAEQLAAMTGTRLAERYAAALDMPAVTASVVGMSTPPAQGAVVLDVGSDVGVRVDSAVLVPAGVVGRVVAVTPGTSTVQLLTSPDSRVAVRVQRARVTGLAQGTGDPALLVVRHVDPLAVLSAGEPAVTLGSPGGWPFPPGLPVGTLAETGTPGEVTRRVSVELGAQLGALDRVVVLVDPSTSSGTDPAASSRVAAGVDPSTSSGTDASTSSGTDASTSPGVDR